MVGTKSLHHHVGDARRRPTNETLTSAVFENGRLNPSRWPFFLYIYPSRAVDQNRSCPNSLVSNFFSISAVPNSFPSIFPAFSSGTVLVKGGARRIIR